VSIYERLNHNKQKSEYTNNQAKKDLIKKVEQNFYLLNKLQPLTSVQPKMKLIDGLESKPLKPVFLNRTPIK